jgi:signal peptidase I
VLGAISAITFGWILTPVRADGDSMLPTYASGRFGLVNRLAYMSSAPRRGDVVAIRLAGPSVLYIKRVIALPGERIAVEDGRVFVNGVELPEPYVRHQRVWNLDEVMLGPTEYFVAGDNRVASDTGRVESERILGRLVF